MCITEYNETETIQLFKEQGHREGRKEGIGIGAENKANEIAASMLLAGEPGHKIMSYTGLDQASVNTLAQKLHVTPLWDERK